MTSWRESCAIVLKRVVYARVLACGPTPWGDWQLASEQGWRGTCIHTVYTVPCCSPDCHAARTQRPCGIVALKKAVLNCTVLTL
jgi:hypothetical protein